jgi:Rad3-related DNA helicase
MLVKSYVAFFEEMLEIVAMCCKLESRTNYIPVYSQHPVSGSSLSFTLLHPGKFLKTQLYDTLDSLVITSATLQINNSFDYFKKILCFDDDFDFLVLESDFDYKKQSLLFIPNDLGSARYNNPVMLQFLEDFISIVKGKTLVLMTSFSSIRDAYLFLNTQLKKLGVTVLAQSIGGSKHKIVNHYKKFYEKSVIL